MSSVNYVNYPVIINSKDRLNQQQPSYRASFKVADLINLNSKKRAYISMPYVNIPPTWKNISSQNNSIIVNESTYPTVAVRTYTVSIPVGNYSVADFINALTVAMTVQSAISGYSLTYTGSYNNSTGQETIQITPNDANHTFSYTFSNTLNTDLKAFMGFDGEFNGITLPFPLSQSPPQPNNYTIISPDAVNFSASIPAVYVRCSIYRSDTCYDTSDGLNGSSGDILQIVPIKGNGYTQIILDNGYEGVENRRVEVTNILNSDITFTLTSDDKNFFVDLGSWNWQAVMMIQYSRETK
jgi:hypothetical protein